MSHWILKSERNISGVFPCKTHCLILVCSNWLHVVAKVFSVVRKCCYVVLMGFSIALQLLGYSKGGLESCYAVTRLF